MRRKRIIPGLSLILIVLLGCNKVDIPVPVEEGEPVFYSDIRIGDFNIDLSAGQGGYVMDADFERDRQVLDFEALIRPESCIDNCPGSFQIVLRNPDAYDPSTFNIDRAIRKGRYEYAAEYRSDSVRITLHGPESNTNASGNTWIINNERKTKDSQIVINVSYDEPTLVEMRTMTGSCVSEQLQTIHPATGGCATRLIVDGGVVVPRTNGVAPFKYTWSSGSRDSIAPLPASTDAATHQLNVHVVDANGCESASSVGLRPGLANDDYCVANFEYKTERLFDRDERDYGKVYLQYIDEDGNKYRSNFIQQPSEASFTVSEVEDFEINEKGQQTKKVTLSFECILYQEGNANTHRKVAGSGVFAFAYPD